MLAGTITIVGVGLIGGSIGLAAKQRRIAQHVIGVDTNQARLEKARQLGAIDPAGYETSTATSLDDVVIVCTPVDQIAGQVLVMAKAAAKGTLITDSGSTKAIIVHEVENQLLEGVAFVGSHPLAGSERQGPDCAVPNLLDGKVVVVTPTKKSTPIALTRTVALWESLGANVRLMSPEDHDRAIAFTSHVPHLLASALAGSLDDSLRDLTASGFRDMTRIASGDPSLWTAIFTQNRQAVLSGLDKLDDRLKEIAESVRNADWPKLTSLLAQAKKVRDALGS
jgi:prephenate dehydrogenase